MATVAYFRTQARRCRNLAGTTMDQRMASTLSAMADEYEEQAAKLEAEQTSVSEGAPE